MSIKRSIANSLAFTSAIFSGFVAAILSQVSTPDYHALFVEVAGLTLICVVATVLCVWTAEEQVPWLVLAVAGLALAASIELGARLLGIRLLG